MVGFGAWSGMGEEVGRRMRVMKEGEERKERRENILQG